MKIKTSTLFEKHYKKLPRNIKNQAEEKEKIFRENPFNLILKTHKLSGKEKESWGFWINYSYRIKFIFLNDDEVLFLDIGTHDIYK
ncbi:type II toxin-antitoxin system mRNA interferase toxin, RelE/StbE family [Patescibacteria group bacterium]|nr:type II toxin-antitoxin system mRNA interferase toxin, RelE/StbE family [Patescibacteria group bacterium]MBU2263694.1 type II toxin-antitoxin system mRNA interferase toxin, RelE/StbE family [Patescibacteria group bacterium]